MKTKKIFLLIPFLFLIINMAGCKKDKDEQLICNCNGEKTTEVTNIEGVVLFNENIQKWCISVSQEGTYDNVELYVPCYMEECYKTAGKNVLFSGTCDRLSLDMAIPAGTSLFCVKISFMSNLN